MTPPDTPETPYRAPQRPGRLRSALSALFGSTVIDHQLRAEWVEMKLALEGVLDQIARAANRQITRDKRDLAQALKRIEELEGDADCGCGPSQVPAAGGYSMEKRMLNRMLVARRGIELPTATRNGGGGHVDGSEGSEAT